MSLLPAIRNLFSRLPETYHLEPWELRSSNPRWVR